MPLILLRSLEKSLRTLDYFCLLYTSDAADERSSVDLGGRRIIKKKKKKTNAQWLSTVTDEIREKKS